MRVARLQRLNQASTIRRKLSALSSLYDQLCNANAVLDNPVNGVARPSEGSNQGKTSAISDAQAATLIRAPQGEGLKARRDRAILATFLFHGLRAGELTALRVRDIQMRRGVLHFEIHGKGERLRYVTAEPIALRLIDAYLEAAEIYNTERPHLSLAMMTPSRKYEEGKRLAA